MRAEPLTRRLARQPGLCFAILLHMALLAWLATSGLRPFLPPALVDEQAIEVDLQTPEQFEALTRPEPAAPPVLAPVQPAVPTPQAQAERERSPSPAAGPDGMVHARRFLAQDVLADARSREARAMLSRLATDERVEQLCALEAMGQIHAWRSDFEPDRVTAYALAETRFANHVLQADGAAFRSGRRWYRLRFTCGVSGDLTQVTAFAFNVGDPIPAARSQALGLPLVH